MNTWNDDAIQFPRLLAEIHSIGLSKEQIDLLAAAMDLDQSNIYDLLDRATEAFDAIKAASLEVK